jgi:hypothetical protein
MASVKTLPEEEIETVETAPEAPAAQIEPEKKTFLVVAWTVLLLVAAVTGYLRYEISNVSAEIAQVRQENADYQSKIGELQNDPSVKAADLLLRNQATVESAIDRSKAQTYVAELMRLHRDYDVDFDTFSFAGDKVSTTVSSRVHVGQAAEPVAKIAGFIGDFRSGSGSAAASMLSLGDVRLVTGDDSARSFAVDLQIKR